MAMISFESDHNSVSVLTLPDVLTKEECEILIDYANKQKKITAKIGTNTLSKEVRSNNLVWLNLSKDQSLNWLFAKIADAIIKVNKDVYKFHLIGLTEDLQFTEYCKINDHYNWHLDSGASNVRKISASIQLSDSEDYEDCDLEFAHLENRTDEERKASRKQGAMIIFPSYLTHKVTPLKSGKRYSLVIWVGGNNFI
jgi:PKHD-type hydroxylase